MKLNLNESLFEEIENKWVEVDSKSVPDFDGSMTDYTWYTDGKKHIFMFGDSDVYEPDETEADWEVEIYPGNEQNAMDEAQEWFDNYKGFEEYSEDYDSLNEKQLCESRFSHFYMLYLVSEEDEEYSLDEFEDISNIYNSSYNFENEAVKNADSLYEQIKNKEFPEIGTNIVDVRVVECSVDNSKNDTDTEVIYNASDKFNNVILEDYSPSLPIWFVNYLNSGNLGSKDVKRKLVNKLNYDLAHMKFIKIPKDEMPTNGFHPILKDDTKQLIYLLRDNRHNVVYMPGVNDDVYLYIDEQDYYKSVPVKSVSKKKLLDYTVALGYIESTDASNKNLDIQKERRDLKKDFIERGKGQYQQEFKEYPVDENGYKDYDHPVISKKWVNASTLDKSGYLIDKDKYKKMLDQADMETYGNQYIRYTKKLEALRDAMIKYMSTMSLNKTKSSWESSLQQVVKYFEDAIYNFEKLQADIDSILKAEDLTDEEKNKHIQRLFNSNNAWSSGIVELRQDIESAWNQLKKLEDNLNENLIFEENSAPEEDKDENPMVKLAKKHNLEILSPLNKNPGAMRIFGTVRDLNNFYKEAYSLGLLDFEDDVDDLYDSKEIVESLKLNSIEEANEFKKIATEIGLKKKDLKNFIKEELENKTGLVAIKEYKQELIENNIDLSILNNKNLIEGVMSDLDIEVQNGATFSSVLENELIPLKKELIALEDADVKDTEKIKEIKEKISKVKAKLMVLLKN